MIDYVIITFNIIIKLKKLKIQLFRLLIIGGILWLSPDQSFGTAGANPAEVGGILFVLWMLQYWNPIDSVSRWMSKIVSGKPCVPCQKQNSMR